MYAKQKITGQSFHVYTKVILYMYIFNTYSDNWHCDTIANIRGPVNLSILNNNLDLLILQLVFYTRQWWSPKTQPPMHFNSTWGPGTGTSLNGVRGAKILPKGFTSFGRRLESVGRQIFLAKQDTAKNTYVVPIFVLLNSFLAFGFWIQKCIQRTSSLLKGVHAPNTFEIARTLVILP